MYSVILTSSTETTMNKTQFTIQQSHLIKSRNFLKKQN